MYRAIPDQFLRCGKAHYPVPGGAAIEDCCCHEGVNSVCNCVWVGGASQVATHMNAMTQGFPPRSFDIISDTHFTCQGQMSNVGANHSNSQMVNTRACYWHTVKLNKAVKCPRRELSYSCRVRQKSKHLKAKARHYITTSGVKD